jgi:hypothetical protein
MNSIFLFGPGLVHKLSCFFVISRKLCDRGFDGDKVDNGFGCIEEPLKRMWRFSDFDIVSDEKPDGNEYGSCVWGYFSVRQSFFDTVKSDARRVLEILEQDGLGFDMKLALDKLCVRISGLLVREVLLGILRNVNYASKMRCAKLGYKFFV